MPSRYETYKEKINKYAAEHKEQIKEYVDNYYLANKERHKAIGTLNRWRRTGKLRFLRQKDYDIIKTIEGIKYEELIALSIFVKPLNKLIEYKENN